MPRDLNVSQLHRSTELTQEWLADLASREPFQTEEQAYALLRAVLHAVRDRLTPGEAARLGAQLPMLVRGFYFEGWRPDGPPVDYHTADGLYRRVARTLAEFPLLGELDVRAATRVALTFLAQEIDTSQRRHVEAQLPEDVRALFPEPAAA